MTMSRASILAAVPLLLVVGGIQVLSIVQQGESDDAGALGRAILLLTLVLLVLGGPIAFNCFRTGTDRARRRWLERSRPSSAWLSDARVDRTSLESLGGRFAGTVDVYPRTFAVVAHSTGLELWGASDDGAPSASLPWDLVTSIESSPPSWTSETGGEVIFNLTTESGYFAIDLVGPLWGTLPASRRQIDQSLRRLNEYLEESFDTDGDDKRIA